MANWVDERAGKGSDSFAANLTESSIVPRIVKPRYKLADLLAQCNQDAPKLDLVDWENTKPTGQEIW